MPKLLMIRNGYAAAKFGILPSECPQSSPPAGIYQALSMFMKQWNHWVTPDLIATKHEVILWNLRKLQSIANTP